MNKKLKQIGIPFILMLIFNLGIYYLTYGHNIEGGWNLHTGILLISGLLFGPYGAIGSVIANILCNLAIGYSPIDTMLSAVINFGISYLAYKLWYENFKIRSEVTKPKLNNTFNFLLFLGIILICGLIYSVLHGKLVYLLYPNTFSINPHFEIQCFLNFINSSLIIGIIGIWLSNRTNFICIPKTSEEFNERLYKMLGGLLIITLLLALTINYYFVLNNYIIIAELVILTIILFAYLTKPVSSKITNHNSKSIPEKIMNIFLLTTLIIIIFGIIISCDSTLITAVDNILPLNKAEVMITAMVLVDILLLVFLIPSLNVLKYIEMKVIEPILSFSEIEKFIHENERIESEGLVDIYSKYINEETEIGTLARSYTDLIKFNNNYIENIQEIEGEKNRIEAELDIATKIQSAFLPTEAIESNEFIVDGYSKPAKEVGGDFFDYYMLDDENLAIIIGDASGKGVPAALLAMITQVMTKQILKHNRNPSEVLYSLNNQICKNNAESMFLTLWLGIFNKTTEKLSYSNAGHNPPLVKENDRFKYLNMDAGIVLGIMEDFDYVSEEITLTDELVIYTDGITDANNDNDEMYGEDRLLKFFNEFESADDPIKPLLSDINRFTEDNEQFDDMTLLYLRTK
jgi:sigma-B regulation protein RsbU (phosphoserine phosphatase)